MSVLPACMSAVHHGDHEGKKKGSDPLELVVVNPHVSVGNRTQVLLEGQPVLNIAEFSSPRGT